MYLYLVWREECIQNINKGPLNIQVCLAGSRQKTKAEGCQASTQHRLPHLASLGQLSLPHLASLRASAQLIWQFPFWNLRLINLYLYPAIRSIWLYLIDFIVYCYKRYAFISISPPPSLPFIFHSVSQIFFTHFKSWNR